MSELFWGIDIGGTNVKLGLVDDGGQIVLSDSIPTQSDQGPDAVIQRIVGRCESLRQKQKISNERIRAVGIGSPGPLSQTQGKILIAPNLVRFADFPLRAAVSRPLEKPAVYDNDVNMITWGEFMFGAGEGVNDLVLFALGTGLGGGIICEGELVIGSEGNGAELGHLIVEPNGRLCNCGQKGCLEAYASATHIARRAEEALADHHPSTLNDLMQRNRRLSSKDVLDAAAEGDALAGQIVDDTARVLALASLNMRHITEPAMIIIAGGVIKTGEHLLIRIRKHYRQMVWTMKDEPLKFRYAALGDDAGVVGAASRAMHAAKQDQLYPPGQ